MCQKSKDMFANAVFLPNWTKIGPKELWSNNQMRAGAQVDAITNGGSSAERGTPSPSDKGILGTRINLQSFWWKSYKKLLAGATSAACGKASSPPWRRHHRRWASRYREADIESELASQVRNHGHNISKIWWNPPIMKSFLAVDDDDTGIGLCGWLLTSISLGEYPFVC